MFYFYIIWSVCVCSLGTDWPQGREDFSTLTLPAEHNSGFQAYSTMVRYSILSLPHVCLIVRVLSLPHIGPVLRVLCLPHIGPGLRVLLDHHAEHRLKLRWHDDVQSTQIMLYTQQLGQEGHILERERGRGRDRKREREREAGKHSSLWSERSWLTRAERTWGQRKQPIQQVTLELKEWQESADGYEVHRLRRFREQHS